MDGKTVESHANDILLAKVDDWQIPATELGQPRRKAAVSPASDDSSSEDESEPENARQRMVRRAQHEREDSDFENEIPKMELAKRIRARELREQDEQAYASEEMQSASDAESEATIDYDISDSMLIDEVQKCASQVTGAKIFKSKKVFKVQEGPECKTQNLVKRYRWNDLIN